MKLETKGDLGRSTFWPTYMRRKTLTLRPYQSTSNPGDSDQLKRRVEEHILLHSGQGGVVGGRLEGLWKARMTSKFRFVKQWKLKDGDDTINSYDFEE